MDRVASALRRLLGLKDLFGPRVAPSKVALLRALGRRPLRTAGQVGRLHELLCFWRAYPDDLQVLEAVEQQLQRFASRRDVKRHRGRLVNSGIAGTDIVYPFSALTARWLARRWGEWLSIEWERVGSEDGLTRLAILVAMPSEVPGLDEAPRPVRHWLRRLRAPQVTDAAFLLERVDRLPAASPVRESLLAELAIPLRLEAGEGTPSRTLAKVARARVTFQDRPLRRDRPDLRAEAMRPPPSVRDVSRRTGERLIDLARGSMVTRERDLDAFVWADPRDVRLAECGEGLQFACIGVRPERRFLLEAVYGFLTLKNGVPIGYALASALNQFSEIAYNVFETFRGGEAARVYGRLLGTVRALFGTEEFTIHPYQLGDGNDEGLDSGAWWFYQKLGFLPRAREARALMKAELGRLGRDSSYRTPRPTLERLVRHHVYLTLGSRRDPLVGAPAMDRIGLAVTEYVTARFGSDREQGTRICGDEAAQVLGLNAWRRLPQAARVAWERWGPLVAVLPGVAGWPPADRRALAEVILAKGGTRESDFVALFDRHRALRRALFALGRRPLDPLSLD